MPIIEWKEKFNLGIEQLDHHHKHLVGLLNSIYDHVTGSSPIADIGSVLNALIDYTIYHFEAEERWMRENEYPGFAEHQGMHGKFATKVIWLHREFLDGRENISSEMLPFLASWLSNHILIDDADLGRFARRPR